MTHNEVRPLLVATSDPRVRGELFRVVQECRVKSLLSSSVREVQAVLATKPVALVVCGTKLDDGTYCDVLRGVREVGIRVPVVVASDPDARTEFNHFLKALHLGAFDFLCFPYRRSELERILEHVLREHELGPAAGADDEQLWRRVREYCDLA